MRQQTVLHVALPVPLRRLFDYAIPDASLPDNLKPGMRIRVPFGKKAVRLGLIAAISTTSRIEQDRLKFIERPIDDQPLYPLPHLELITWAADYYQHPPGEVFFNTLPTLLRHGKPAVRKKHYLWKLTAAGGQIEAADLTNAPRQARIIKQLSTHPGGLTPGELGNPGSRQALRALADRGLIIREEEDAPVPKPPVASSPNFELNADQKDAVQTCKDLSPGFHCILLNGVTGSGKTAVYIELIKACLRTGRQALVLVPEISLTPQLIGRLQASLQTTVAVLHSGLSHRDRLQSWLLARDGIARVVLGTRSAVWTPLSDPGMVIVDEEHDLSYKQQDGFRYCARDVAIMKGKLLGIPVLLGSATPSMESLQNSASGRYIRLDLPSRAGKALQPDMQIVDVRAQQMHGALSASLLHAIQKRLDARQQVLLFLNKRGFSPVLMCHDCGWTSKCNRCDIQMTYFKLAGRISCHHCGRSIPAVRNCPDCGSGELIQIGHGTERIVETLTEIFPRARIIRIDRDTTRNRGAMEQMVDAIRSGEAEILVGTQILAKGHHFPNLSLVGVVDADRGLFSADFRASEYMAQLIVQVSGRAGRSSNRGEVLLQTHYPEHPLLLSLVRYGYMDFSKSLLEERKSAGLPPYSYLALLRAEDYQPGRAEKFLTDARSLVTATENGVEAFGPVPAPIEKKAGRYRFQLLIQSATRTELQQMLAGWTRELEKQRSGKQVRWSLDVDPREML